MLKEKLKEIEKTESQAADIVTEAQARAEQITRAAAKDGAALEERTELRAVETISSILDEAKPALLARLSQIEESAAHQEVALRSKAEPRVREAARALVESLSKTGTD